MAEPDILHRFIFERSNVRGELVHLDSAWQACLRRCDYPDAVRQLLGEAFAATALLAATVRFAGSLTLQINSAGPVTLLVVQVQAGGGLRGLAHWRGEVDDEEFRQLLGTGRLAITIDPGEGRRRYQGIVGLDCDSLAEVLHDYFNRSEQLPTRLWLAADGRRAAGLLLQQLPRESEDADIWNRSVHLTNTVTDAELLKLDARQILDRLYAEEDVRLFEGERQHFRCDCSRERVAAMLVSLGRDEVQSTLAEEGRVAVRCEFCNASYEFDAVDVEQLFAAQGQPSVAPTRH